ncbi:DUF4262 domain-containing protein [Tenacibaculum sp. M341]|uniref:DUF4262 domain-containing protein n=1 Tax=Tenacibaculum sp. M341 TaxID=2530339 RepID=UPI0010470E82|nr:DUF4262 domain-containing protein [Tenacibaculum sp. M341]TCI84800.1 DUF4262 domain-containing protein [Tenacibaculum sp. M341]
MENQDKQIKEKIVNNIKEYDCYLAILESDGYSPAFVYTIGLYEKFKHPEIIIFGLQTDVMGHLLNELRDEIRKGNKYNPNQQYSGVLEGYDIQFLEVNQANYADYLGYASWYYNNTFDFPVLQMIWPDKESKWPWEIGFNENWKFKQPLLDRNTDFKYQEERYLGVYTTFHALEGKPILYVYHNEDGDWQFHTEYEPKIEDAKLICLEEIVKIDSTLNEIYYLNYGQTAYRNEIGGEWTIEDSKNEEENTVNRNTNTLFSVKRKFTDFINYFLRAFK